MMSSWKQKLKEFSSSSRPKPPASPDESSLNSVSSFKSENIFQKQTIPTGSGESNNRPEISSSNKGPVSSLGNSRRETITPNFEALTITESVEVNRPIQSSEEHGNKNFNPGLLTVKIYQGSEFVIPFDVSRDSNLIAKLQSTANDRHMQSHLSKSLMKIPLEADGTIPLSHEHLIASLIPATIRIPPSDLRNSLIYFTLEFDNNNVMLEAESGTIDHPVFNKVSQFDVTKPDGDLKFQMFVRLPSMLTEARENNHDVLIGSESLHIDLNDLSIPVRIYNHILVRFTNDSNLGSKKESGNLTITVDFKPYQSKHLCIEDFDLLKVIGKGSFGKVMQVRKKDSGKIYALKAIRKSHIVSRSEVVHTLAERTVLARVDNPFVVPLKFSFQSPEKLYLVLSFINGGELFYHLQKEGRFDLQRSRLYTAELLSALECLHSLDVIYRDLKPENILLDFKGHIALCDFGLCKLNMKNNDKTKTFCGTPEYLAPELLLGNGYTKSVDWWTLGVLLYEMLTGLPPYYDTDVSAMYQKILKDPLRFPNDLDPDAKDILIHLLARDPKIRLGTNGSSEIKAHSFFNCIDWKRLYAKGYQPPFKPRVKDGFDTSNFDKEFTNEQPVDSVINEFLSESVQKQFGGWTYVGTENLAGSVQR